MPDFKSWAQRRLGRLRSDLDRRYDDLCGDLGLTSPRREAEAVLTDEADALVLTLALDEADPGKITLSVDERSVALEMRVSKVVPGGVSRSTVRRTVSLPCRVRPAEATAEISGGRMVVRLPKAPAACAVRLRIDT